MDEKFHSVSENLVCPFCKSGNIRIIGGAGYTGDGFSRYYKNPTIVKCIDCDVVMFERDLEEKEEKCQ